MRRKQFSKKPKQEMNNHKKNHLKGFLFNMLRVFCLFHVHVQKRKEGKPKQSNRKERRKKEAWIYIEKKRRTTTMRFVCVYMFVIFILCETMSSANLI